jgi:putative inorganic carbon (HCO3(-)) transporter
MAHPDLAHAAAVLAAIGAVLLLAGRGRAMVLGGLVVLGAGEVALLDAGSGSGALDRLSSPAGAAAGLLALGAVGVAAAILVARPGWLPVVAIVAAPLRPPISFESGGGFPLSVATNGQLGRLLPLYFVLGAATLALIWRAFDGRTSQAAVRALPRVVAWPAAAFIAFASLSLLWADHPGSSVDLLAYFTLPFALLLAILARSPFPDWAPKAMARAAIALGTLFAVIGLYQAATRDLFFYAPNLEVSNANSNFFRVTSLFGDPSLYGRHVVLAMTVLLVCLALQRIDLRLGIGLLVVLWLGLFFSYSQSSFVALVVVMLAIALAAGDARVRKAVAGIAVAGVVVVAAYGVVKLVDGGSLRQVTSDRTSRVQDATRVIRHHPVVGVGIGNQARVSRRLAGSDRPTANFVSHTTPLTVAAELGVIGLALYAWLIVGGTKLLLEVAGRERALGLALGMSFLALFVHALFYSGFLEDPLTWVVLGVGAGWLAWRPAAEREAAPA